MLGTGSGFTGDPGSVLFLDSLGSVDTDAHFTWDNTVKTLNLGDTSAEFLPDLPWNSEYLASFSDADISDVAGGAVLVQFVGKSTATTNYVTNLTSSLLMEGEAPSSLSDLTYYSHNSLGTTRSIGVGLHAGAGHYGAGDVTDLVAIECFSLLFANGGPVGTVDNLYGFWARTNGVTAGTATNNYGLYLQDRSGVGTNNWNLYSAGNGLNYFGGQVQIAGGSPGAGKVLTSDAVGLGSWQTPAAGGSGGEPLTNGDVSYPEHIFADGDVIVA